jgi:hypothetical protein
MEQDLEEGRVETTRLCEIDHAEVCALFILLMVENKRNYLLMRSNEGESSQKRLRAAVFCRQFRTARLHDPE